MVELSKICPFCKIFQLFSAEMFDIVANSECDGTEKHCYNLGPFVLGNEAKRSNRIQDNSRIMMNNPYCLPGDKLSKLSTAKASAVFRVVSSQENLFIAEGRTDISTMTISAEGTWNSSSRLLCMVGCVGLAETGLEGCNSRICLCFPISFHHSAEYFCWDHNENKQYQFSQSVFI